MFLDHTQRRSTVARTSLDERSARRRDLYLTTHDTHNRQISMPPVGFEPTISAGERQGRGYLPELITRPEESYRLWCVVVCDLETSRIGAPYIYIYDISSLRVNDLTLILVTLRKLWTPNNASKWQMGFNSAFKGLKCKNNDMSKLNVLMKEHVFLLPFIFYDHSTCNSKCNFIK